MIAAGSRTGWQTTLADLALILFMITAASIAQRPDAGKAADSVPVGAPAQGEALAIYRAAPGAPPLAAWLASQAIDERQNLTIIARYRPGEAAQAAQSAVALEHAAAAAGRSARIVIEAGEVADLTAVLDYDGRSYPSRNSGASAPSGTQIAERLQFTTGAAPDAADER
jgi:hypothetical protein